MEKRIYYTYQNQQDGVNDFILKEVNRYWTNCFATKEEATEHFNVSKKIAEDRYNKVVEGIRKLRDEIGHFDYDYFVNGDDQGIEQEGLYINIKVNGYDFEFLQ